MTQAAGAVPLEALQAGLKPRPTLLVRMAVLAKRKPLGAISLVIILIMVLLALFADILAPHDPLQMYGRAVMKPPSAEFPLGTDNFGRDMLSRIIYGSRISLFVGISSIAMAMVIGAFLGMVSAYFEGRLDMFLQRIMDALDALPGLVLALAILAALGAGVTNVIMAIGISQIPRNNRVIRGSVLSEKRNMYAEAAKAIGCTDNRTMWRHIFPNVTAPLIILAATELGGAILAEASLSFLGVGVPPPNPSWGGMLSGPHRTYMLAAPWMAIFPGVAIMLAVLGWNLLGDALRDIWDPRLRAR